MYYRFNEQQIPHSLFKATGTIVFIHYQEFWLFLTAQKLLSDNKTFQIIGIQK